METVAMPRNRLDKLGTFRIILQGPSQTLHGRVQAMFKINKSVLWPEPIAQVFARNQFAGALQQKGEQLQGLAGDLQSHPMLA